MVTFVILHYMALQATESVVNHILNDLDGEKRIVIVDNASPNKSGEMLFNLYKDNSNVTVVLNAENLGFAKGCNIGYQYAKKTNPKYIVLLNNDIEFEDNGFINQVDRSYMQSRFDVLGPDIFVSETGVHQNPKKIDLYSLEQVIEINNHNKSLLNQNKVFFFIRAYIKNISMLRAMKVKRDFKKRAVISNKTQENVVLHGALLVFSKDFIDKIDEPFNNGTFFYFETEIMSKMLSELNLTSKYDPSIRVRHHQNTATKESFHNIIMRQRFQLENMVNSTNVYIQLFENSKKD